MSKVAIKGNASGTGTFTLEAPNSNTDRTLVLPDEAGTVLTSASTISGLGSLTMADQFYKTTNTAGDEDPIDDWQRIGTNDGGGSIGSAMTVSSGIFTFPETGIYKIEFQGMLDGNVFSRFNTLKIFTTTNGSTYSEASRAQTFMETGSTFGAIYLSFIFDVQSTSTHKCKFGIAVADTNVTLLGSTTEIRTGLFFTRLGDT